MPPATADPAFQVACPKCSAAPGEKCKNYLGKGKFTCKERVTAWASDPLNVGPGIAAAQPGPIVCKPLGSLPLTDVPGFPDGLYSALSAAGCVTLADLEKRVARQSKAHSSDEARVFAAIRTIPGVDAPKAIAACDAVMKHLNVGAQVTAAVKAAAPAPAAKEPRVKVTKVMLDNGPATIVAHPDTPVPGTPIAKPAPADDFDEHTPPPKTAPRGSKVPPFVRVPPGGVEAEYAAWERDGRVPTGSQLARFVGSLDSPSGYVIGGRPVPLARLDELRLVTAIAEETTGRRFAVFAPEGA